MILKMKKFRLLCTETEGGALAKAMAACGEVMDLRTSELSPHKELELDSLAYTLKDAISVANAKKAPSSGSITMDITELLEVFEQYQQLQVQKKEIEKELELALKSAEVFGDIDSNQVLALKHSGLYLEARIVEKSKLTLVSDVSEFAIEVGSHEAGRVYFFAGFNKEVELPGVSIPFNPSSINERARMKATIDSLHSDIESKIDLFKTHEQVLKESFAEGQDRVLLETMVQGAKIHRPDEHASFLVFKGWIPEKHRQKFEASLGEAEKSGLTFVYEIEEVGHEEEAPVALKNAWFNRIFEPVTKIFSLPGYHEFDPTPLLAPFFLFFVGMCLADFGYGVLFLVIGLVARLFSKKRSQKDIADLIIVLGLGMVILGVVFNVIVGYKFIAEHHGETGLFTHETAPPLLNSLVLFPRENEIMAFSLVLGFIQMLFGILYRAFHHTRQHGIEHGLHSFGHFFIMLGVALMAAMSAEKGALIGPIPIGDWAHAWANLPDLANVLIIIGLALVLFFTNLKMNFFLRPFGGLWAMYEIITGILSDTLSYVRLFALGLAGGLLGLAMNQVALSAKGDSDSIVGIIAMVLILFVGHFVNFGLALLGSFVHPVRLTLVEFYKALGFKGGGIPYTPVALQSQSKTLKS